MTCQEKSNIPERFKYLLGNKFAVGNKGGHPKIWTQERILDEAKAFLEWMNLEDSVYFNSFAIERGYPPQKFSEFAEESIEFAEVLKYAKQWQEQKLVKNALLNKTNTGMTKFVLNVHHDWIEKNHVILNTADPLSFVSQDTDGKSKELVDGKI